MIVGTLQQAMEDMKRGVTDFTRNGQCISCGLCCANLLPVSPKEIKEIKRYVKKHRVREQVHSFPTAARTLDLCCPFRSEDERKCMIYAVRPKICRLFKCDLASRGIWLPRNAFSGTEVACDMRATFFGRQEGYKAQSEDKANMEEV